MAHNSNIRILVLVTSFDVVLASLITERQSCSKPLASDWPSNARGAPNAASSSLCASPGAPGVHVGTPPEGGFADMLEF